MMSPPRITSIAPGTSFIAMTGTGSQHAKASTPLDSSATAMSGGGVFTRVTSCSVRPAFSITASAYRWLIVPNEAAIFLPLRVFRSPW